MSTRIPRTPSYRLHKPTGQAVVTLDGRDCYLGKHGTPESIAEYNRLIVEYISHGRRLSGANDLTVAELVVAYVKFADGYYRKNGKPTGETTNIRYALKGLRQLYGHTLAREFGPLALKATRQHFIDSGLCRNECNRRTRLIVRAFKWAVENELVPASVHHGLKAVSGLRKGRSAARESVPVKPVNEAHVDALEGLVAPQVWAMIQLQRLTGMRPGEVVAMRAIDLDTSGPVWTYTPAEHKTEHHGKGRVVYLGPKAQEVVKPWLRTEVEAFLFRPDEAMAARKVQRRAARKSKVQPSQLDRRKPRPRKNPGDQYTVASYRRAITYGCDRADVPRWHPNQLRHNAATRIRREFGLDVARVILGHSSPVVTEVYAELDEGKALAVVAQSG